jgi:HAD superfamily hydrolase (TIGR01509 family)
MLNSGCRELFEWLDEHRVRVALITRNSARSVTTVIERHGLRIDLILTRADAPPKPSPDALHLACKRLQVSGSDAWMVGDGQYDVEAGLAAGIRTVWVSHRRRPRPFDAIPWKTVEDLHELQALLRACA